MWRKFLCRDDIKFGTRMVVTALVLASVFRAQFEERARDSRKWLDRILDERERAKIVESAWRSIVNKELQAEFELNKNALSHAETQAKLERVLNSSSWRITQPLRTATRTVRHSIQALRLR
jgi:hypothetical protein